MPVCLDIDYNYSIGLLCFGVVLGGEKPTVWIEKGKIQRMAARAGGEQRAVTRMRVPHRRVGLTGENRL